MAEKCDLPEFDSNMDDEDLFIMIRDMQVEQQLIFLEIIIQAKSISDVVGTTLKIHKQSKDHTVRKKAIQLSKRWRALIKEELEQTYEKLDTSAKSIKIVLYDAGDDLRMEKVFIANLMKPGNYDKDIGDKYLRVSSNIFDKLCFEKKENNRWHYLIDVDNKIMWNERIDGSDKNENNKMLNKMIQNEVFKIINDVESNIENHSACIVKWKIPDEWDGTLPVADIQIIMR